MLDKDQSEVTGETTGETQNVVFEPNLEHCAALLAALQEVGSSEPYASYRMMDHVHALSIYRAFLLEVLGISQLTMEEVVDE